MTTIQQIPTSTIHTHSDNPRFDATTDGKALQTSIKARGILQPLTVAPHPDIDGEWLLIDGHRRLGAAQVVGLGEVPAFVRADLTTRASQITAMLTANGQRADLTAVEQGSAYQLLLDLDLTEAAIAKQVGRSRKHVHQHVLVAGLPEGARDRIHTGQMTLTDGLRLAEFADHPDLVEKLMKALGSYSENYIIDECRATITRRSIREEIRVSGKVPADKFVEDADGVDGHQVIASKFTPGYQGLSTFEQPDVETLLAIWDKWTQAGVDATLLANDRSVQVMVPFGARKCLGVDDSGQESAPKTAADTGEHPDEAAAEATAKATAKAEAAEHERLTARRAALLERAAARHAAIRQHLLIDEADDWAREKLIATITLRITHAQEVKVLAMLLGTEHDASLEAVRDHLRTLPLGTLYRIATEFPTKGDLWVELVLTGFDGQPETAWAMAAYLRTLHALTGYVPCELEYSAIDVHDRSPKLRKDLGMPADPEAV